MVRLKMKKGKINIDKRLTKIEIWILLGVLCVIALVVIFTRPVSSEKAQIIVDTKYNETIEKIAKVLIGTEWIEIGDECVEQDGYTFCKSMTESMQTYSDLKEYIESVCTKDFTKELLEKQELMYRDIDGALYILDVNRGKDVFYAGLNSIKIKEITSHKIQAEVVCNYYIDLETRETYTMSFIYEIEKSWGTWKTSSFTLPY